MIAQGVLKRHDSGADPKARLVYWHQLALGARFVERRVQRGSWTDEEGREWMTAHLREANDWMLAFGITPFLLSEVYPLTTEWRESFDVACPDTPVPHARPTAEFAAASAAAVMHETCEVLRRAGRDPRGEVTP